MALKNQKYLNILSIIIAILLIIVSAAGAFMPSTYERDAPSMAAQGIGQDMINLFFASPILLIALWRMIRGGRIATLIYGGILFYIAYSFVIYAMGVHFNRLFLLYCAILGLSFYALVIYLMDMRDTNLASWFERSPEKLVSVYLFIVAFIFYALWLKSVVPAILDNTIPKEVADYDLLVNPVHVLDMAIVLPGIILGGILIRRKQNLGYLIATMALVFMIILTIALAGMVIVLIIKEISEDFTVAAVFGMLTLTTSVVAYLLFRSIQNP